MQLHKNRDCLVEHGVLTACGTLPLDHQQHLGLDLSTASLLDGLCPFVVTCMKTSKQRRSDDVFDTDCDVSNLSMACDANVTEQGPCAKLTHDQWRELLSEARAIWFHQVCPVSFVFFFFSHDMPTLESGDSSSFCDSDDSALPQLLIPNEDSSSDDDYDGSSIQTLLNKCSCLGIPRGSSQRNGTKD